MKTKYVNYYEHFKKEAVTMFDFTKMPVFPKSEENTVMQIVKSLREVIITYGIITLADVYDIIEMYEPSLKANTDYINIRYGWRHINDLYILHTDEGVTIGMQCKPILLI